MLLGCLVSVFYRRWHLGYHYFSPSFLSVISLLLPHDNKTCQRHAPSPFLADFSSWQPSLNLLSRHCGCLMNGFAG